ncbi:hypothetical protein NFK08_05165 [Enterobacter roggenkampii]|uniref:hypothetical protein n=1 Tax=Enterobacter roggenkampii TaxID=1812935 RepID=UPI00242E9FF9|nr:hypothetical protein [Enterobacter roggenkampii]WFX59433.1 hypothetical protein NFK08_05165 [Enterobacter roggenkampii]
MRDEQKLNPVNELERIRALAVAAGYLSTTGKEATLLYELVDLVGEIARKSLEHEGVL